MELRSLGDGHRSSTSLCGPHMCTNGPGPTDAIVLYRSSTVSSTVVQFSLVIQEVNMNKNKKMCLSYVCVCLK